MKISNLLTSLCVTVVVMLSFSTVSYAACSSPAGIAGQQMYNSTHNVMQFCDGTNWLSMANTDGDTLAGLSCADGEVAKWNNAGSAWQCAVDGAGAGDDLGNHTATQALDMATFDINAADINVGSSITLNNTDSIAIGPDIDFSSSALIAADSSLYFNIDSDNNSAGADFIFLKDAATSAGAEIFRIDETGLVTVQGKIANLTDPTAAQDAATKAYVDAAAGGAGDDLGNHTATTTLDMNTNSITNVVQLSANNPTNVAVSATSAGAGLGSVIGTSTATTGVTTGVYGDAASTTGRGVRGTASSATGINYGVYGQSISTSGYGVYGINTAATGATYGVQGVSNSTSGIGVHGYGAATSGVNYGVYGQSDSAAGFGGYFSNTNSGVALGIGSGVLDMGSNKITNVTDPTAAQDAATKAYVDAAAGGGGTPGGADTQIQFNDGGAFAGNSALTFNKTNETATLLSTTNTATNTTAMTINRTGTISPGYSNQGLAVSVTGSSTGSQGININVANNDSSGYGVYSTASGTNHNAAGLYGRAIATGNMNRGLVGIASDSVINNYGVHGRAIGNAGIANYGVYGDAYTTSGDNYGVYGRAIAATAGTNYGGYFDATNGGTNIAIKVVNAPVDMTTQKIINLADPTAAQDAATKAYVDANAGGGADNLGDHTATQDLDMDNNGINNINDITINGNVADVSFGGTYGIVSASEHLFLNIDSDNNSTSGAFSVRHNDGTVSGSELFYISESGDIGVHGGQIHNVGDPTAAQDAATKAYVDATAGGAPDTQTFSSSGTWTKPSSGGMVMIECWGGGGGGGSGSFQAGGGGGSFDRILLPKSSLGATVTVTVGNGGTANNNGGNSTFGSYLTAYGGKKGNTATSIGGDGGGMAGNLIVGDAAGEGGASWGGGAGGHSNGGGGSSLWGGGGGGGNGFGGGTSEHGGNGAAGTAGGGGGGGGYLNASGTTGGKGRCTAITF